MVLQSDGCIAPGRKHRTPHDCEWVDNQKDLTMDSKEFELFSRNVIEDYCKATEAITDQIKTWVGNNIMTLNPDQTERCMRMIRLIDRLGEQATNMTTGQDLESSSWKVRILSCLRDCGGRATTDRIRQWMEEKITFNERDKETVHYGTESVTRWWHTMRPNLTHMTKDGTIERAKHGTYSITPAGEDYLDS